MTTAAYTATIAGASVNVVGGTLSVQNQVGQRSTGSLTVWTALGVLWDYGTPVKVYDENGALVYAGFITQDRMSKPSGSQQGTGYLLHALSLMDNCYKADKRIIFYSTLNRASGAIVLDLLDQALAQEGVITTPGSVATGVTISEVIWNGKQISAALDYLAKICGYWWNIDRNNVLWFQPYGGLPAPWTLDGSQADSVSGLSVVNGNTRYVNRQYVRGAYAETGTQTETFHGDGVRRNWTLSYDIASTSSHALTITVNGVAQTISAKGAGGYHFYADVGDAVIAQDTSQTLLTSGDTLVVTYRGRYPILALAASSSLITAQRSREGGGTGYVESLYTDTKVHNQAAAFQIAGGMLSHYGQDMTLLEFDTRMSGLAEGQMLTVTLTDFGLTNKQMLVSSITISDQRDGVNIWFHVQAVGSPYDVAHWQSWFQNLMSQQADPSELSDTSDGSVLALFLAGAAQLYLRTIGSMSRTTCPLIGATLPFVLC